MFTTVFGFAASALAAEVPVEGHVTGPRWSTDGRFLSWTVDDRGGTAVQFTAEVTDDARVSPVRTVVGGAAAGCLAGRSDWIREGYLVFDCVLATGESRLFYTAGGKSLASELFPPTASGSYSSPTSRLDARKLVVLRDGPGTARLVVRDSGSARLQELTGDLPGAAAPSFAPDGTVVFERRAEAPDDGADVWTVALDGTEPRLLVGGPKDQRRPVVASDGSVVFFESAGQDRPVSIVALRGAVRRVLAEGVQVPRHGGPSLDPRGSRVVWAWEGGAHRSSLGTATLDGEVGDLVMSGAGTCVDPALTTRGGKVLLAAACLPVGKSWRELWVEDVTSQLTSQVN